MPVRIRFVWCLVLAFLLPSSSALAQGLPRVQCIPEDALVCLNLSQPKVLLERLTDQDMTDAITSLPWYQQQQSQPKVQGFFFIIRYLEASLGTDWRSGLAQLTGGGITLAVCPNDTVVAIVDSEDQSLLERLHGILLNFARSEAEKQGQTDRIVCREYDGTTIWSFDGNEAHAIVGKRFIFANSPTTLESVLKRHSSENGTSLAQNPTFQSAQQTTTPDAIGTVFVNLKPFLELPQTMQLLEKQRTNPLAALLFSGIGESFRHSTWLSVGLSLEDQTVTLDALTDGEVLESSSPAVFAVPHEEGPCIQPNLSVPRRIAALSLYRDLHSFYAAKDDLFPERTSGLIFFENMMGIFFTGRDLTSEVLAETQPDIRVVVAEQQYDPDVGIPQMRLPAFALVLRLRDPDRFRIVVEEAWQKAVGLINFTRGQQALPGLIIDRLTHGQTKFTVAYFSTIDVEDKLKLDTRFNLCPTLAMPDEYLIFSSTEGLARDLIDAIGSAADLKDSPLAQTHSRLEIDGTQLVSILHANRQSLIRGDMVKKGKTHEEAQAGVDILLTVLGCLDEARLDIGARDGLMAVKLQAQLQRPHPQRHQHQNSDELE